MYRRTSRRIVVVTTDRHGLHRPIVDEISSSALFITLDGRYDGSLRLQRSVEGLHSRTLESWNMGTGATSIIIMTNLHDGPSWLLQSITFSVIPHLVRLPHIPLSAALRCHLRTVTSMTYRHKFPTWSLLHFFAQKPPRSSLDRFTANKENFF